MVRTMRDTHSVFCLICARISRRTRRYLFRVLAIIAVSLVTHVSFPAVPDGPHSNETSHETGTASRRRPLEVHDLFRLEDLGLYFGPQVTFSSDGQAIAFTRVRAINTMANVSRASLSRNDAADVWVRSPQSTAVRNLTNGSSDGSGWWSPQWSPDGRYLAMLSTRGQSAADVGANIWLWVWDTQTDRLYRLSSRAVDPYPYQISIKWVDPSHLVCALLKEDATATVMLVNSQTQRIATQEWRRAGEGKMSTASVLDTGARPDRPRTPLYESISDVVRIDVATGAMVNIAERHVSQDPWSEFAGSVWASSPDGRYVAFESTLRTYAPNPASLPGLVESTAIRLQVAGAAGQERYRSDPVFQDIVPRSLRWSLDGEVLAFVGYRDAKRRAQLVFVHASDGSTKAIDLAGCVPSEQFPEAEWTPDQQFLVRCEGSNATPGDHPAQPPVWRVSTATTVRESFDAPQELWPEAGTSSMVGIRDGTLWRLDPGTGHLTAIANGFRGRVQSIAWPAKRPQGIALTNQDVSSYAEVVIRVKEPSGSGLYRVNLGNSRYTRIASLAADAEIAAYSPSTQQAAVIERNRGEVKLSIVGRSLPRALILMEANGFLGNVAEAALQPIDYTAENGARLKGWILLPVDYVKGRRYPLITYVYPGDIQDDDKPAQATFSGLGRYLDMQVAAAHGYAVLLPSMPRTRVGQPDDPLLGLTNGVLPAVDSAIGLGIADPARIYLLGHSFGGFATYGLITLTHRFAAAVAAAGFSDLFSLYGTFVGAHRYGTNPNGPNPYFLELGQDQLGAPPYADFDRYLRNSAIFRVTQVDTPLLMLHGDLDYVPIEQAEEFFTLLGRQGKRARFVRYWGEGHVLQSPANVEDFWRRVFVWFSEDREAATVAPSTRSQPSNPLGPRNQAASADR
jgi:dipeptidyl aminopeptidase/acylaminoacyl peptidase